MLQHSRSGSGQKELTDINSLADEFLRLSYHGIRAKEKGFNATIKTEYDHSMQKVMLNPGDMGRVFLNLFNNAFYSVFQKQKRIGGGYDPVVSIRTARTDDGVEIRIKDNGTGIPEDVKEKIFHPFFTTKPSGQGTGLGLSLSYDIVTKGHGGHLLVETIEEGFAEFIIQLPVKDKTRKATAV
jgi:signal transduction histidine kinase